MQLVRSLKKLKAMLWKKSIAALVISYEDTYSGVDTIVAYYTVYSIFILIYIIYTYMSSTRTLSDVEGIPQPQCTSFHPYSISIIIKRFSHRAPFSVITFTHITFDKLPKHKHARGKHVKFHMSRLPYLKVQDNNTR